MTLLLGPFRWPDDVPTCHAFLASVPGPAPNPPALSLKDALLHGTDPGALAEDRGRVLGLLFLIAQGPIARIHPSLERTELEADLVAALEEQQPQVLVGQPKARRHERSSPQSHQPVGFRTRRTLREGAHAAPVATLLALTLLQVAIAVAIVALGPALPLGSELAQRLATTLVSAALAALLLQSLGLWREAGFVGPPAWRVPLAGLAATAVGLAPLLTGLAPIPLLELGALVAGMAVNSFAEEAVFRGLALAVLLPLGFWRAVLWTSLAFGFLHVVRLLFGAELAPTLVQMAFATNFGLLMGALRLRTGTIWWPVLAHTVVNVAGSLAAETNETWGLVVSLIWQVGTLALAIALMPSPRTSARAAATRAVPA